MKLAILVLDVQSRSSSCSVYSSSASHSRKEPSYF